MNFVTQSGKLVFASWAFYIQNWKIACCSFLWKQSKRAITIESILQSKYGCKNQDNFEIFLSIIARNELIQAVIFLRLLASIRYNINPNLKWGTYIPLFCIQNVFYVYLHRSVYWIVSFFSNNSIQGSFDEIKIICIFYVTRHCGSWSLEAIS